MLPKIGSCMTVILLCITVSFPKKMLKKVNRQVALSAKDHYSYLHLEAGHSTCEQG